MNTSLAEDILKSPEFRKRVGVRPGYYMHVFEAIRKNCIPGLWMEFGVAGGKSIAWLSANAPANTLVYGFDSFSGLPEEFNDGENSFPIGTFKADNPDAELARIETRFENVRLIKGMFQDTLNPFLSKHDGACSVIHIDCDLYSSTSYVLKELRHRITTGTYILFDEILGSGKMQEHEYRAFAEFLLDTKYDVRWIAHLSNAPQATCRVIST